MKLKEKSKSEGNESTVLNDLKSQKTVLLKKKKR